MTRIERIRAAVHPDGFPSSTDAECIIVILDGIRAVDLYDAAKRSGVPEIAKAIEALDEEVG